MQLGEDRYGDRVGVCVRRAVAELGAEAPVVPTIAWAAANACSESRRACASFAGDGRPPLADGLAAACDVLAERLGGGRDA